MPLHTPHTPEEQARNAMAGLFLLPGPCDSLGEGSSAQIHAVRGIHPQQCPNSQLGPASPSRSCSEAWAVLGLSPGQLPLNFGVG